MALIDIGPGAIGRPNSGASGYTRVEIENPANDSGTIDVVEIYAVSNLSNCEVATFIDKGSNVLSTRDRETIGSVASGSKQTFSSLDMDVQTGDYIGMYFTGGDIEKHNTGEGGYWWLNSDEIPCTDVTFNIGATVATSIYGTGETAVVRRIFITHT